MQVFYIDERAKKKLSKYLHPIKFSQSSYLAMGGYTVCKSIIVIYFDLAFNNSDKPTKHIYFFNKNLSCR